MRIPLPGDIESFRAAMHKFAEDHPDFTVRESKLIEYSIENNIRSYEVVTFTFTNTPRLAQIADKKSAARREILLNSRNSIFYRPPARQISGDSGRRPATKGEPRIVLASLDTRAAARNAPTYVATMDEIFIQLTKNKLLDNNFDGYCHEWRRNVRPLAVSLGNQGRLRTLLLYQDMVLSTDKRYCTVEFQTDKGVGANIKYIKSVDAKLGGKPMHEVESPTKTTKALERATYDFEAWRGNKKTGSRKSVECIEASVDVSINEP